MKNRAAFLLICLSMLTLSCSSTKSASVDKNDLDKELTEKNRGQISLLDRIRKKSGIVVRNGIPTINKTVNSFGGNQEPLYVLNSYVVGSSFNSINQLVDSFNVKEIKVLSGADTSEYGTRGAKGVIIITTYD